MEGAGLLSIAVLLVVGLISIPFSLARGAFGLLWSTHGLRKRWGSVPLETKSHIRLRTATFVLVVLIGASAFRLIPYDKPIEIWCAVCLGLFALLNLGAGFIGVRYAARCRHDPLKIFWWSVGAASCVAALVYAGVVAGW